MIHLRTSRRWLIGAILVTAPLPGCKALGPGRIPPDQFNYNAAVARSSNEQMLLNIVRLRYLQVPDFLTVSSVIAGYTYQGGVGVAGQRAIDRFDETFVGGSANLSYTERPTITYTPLAGKEFSRRLLQTIPIEVLFSLGQSGWSPEILFRMAVQRIGETENMGFTYPESEAGLRAEAEKLAYLGRPKGK